MVRIELHSPKIFVLSKATLYLRLFIFCGIAMSVFQIKGNISKTEWRSRDGMTTSQMDIYFQKPIMLNGRY